MKDSLFLGYIITFNIQNYSYDAYFNSKTYWYFPYLSMKLYCGIH